MSKKIGYMAATIHVFLFICFVFYINFGTKDGQSRLLWALWLPIDFPISLIVLKGFHLISGESNYMSQIRIWLPWFVHGILGPIWWFYLCRFIGKLFSLVTGHKPERH
jgi:hypothetical protein